ncbi:MAG: MBL fold metallo-hydrolase [candidate division WOR-3 bacterium]
MRLDATIIPEGPRVTIHYVAFDSFGVKSMCTRVETPDVTVTIDPGVSIQSARFPLPQGHRAALLSEFLEAVSRSCEKSQVVVISHYHLDHFIPARDPRLYSGKVLFAKGLEGLPQKQLTTAQRFFRAIDGLPKEVIWADGRQFRFKKTVIGFSSPVWHGQEAAEPGQVVMTEVSRGREKVLVTSDISGPTEPATTDAICAANARDLVIDGYPTFLLGQSGPDVGLVQSIVNLCRILAQRSVKSLVVDHHLCRDYRYPVLLKLAYDKARQLKKRFGTAAELQGRTSAVIEGYQNYGPTRWHRWQPLELDSARQILEQAVNQKRLKSDWLTAFDRWVA